MARREGAAGAAPAAQDPAQQSTAGRAQLQVEEIFELLLRARKGDLEKDMDQRGTASPIDPRVDLFYVIPGEPRRAQAREFEMRVKYSNCVRSKIWWSPKHGNRLGLVTRAMSMKTRSEAHQLNLSFQHGFRGHWVSLLERPEVTPITDKAVIRDYVLDKAPSLVQFWPIPESTPAPKTATSASDVHPVSRIPVAPALSSAPAPHPRASSSFHENVNNTQPPRPYASVVRADHARPHQSHYNHFQHHHHRSEDEVSIPYNTGPTYAQQAYGQARPHPHQQHQHHHQHQHQRQRQHQHQHQQRGASPYPYAHTQSPEPPQQLAGPNLHDSNAFPPLQGSRAPPRRRGDSNSTSGVGSVGVEEVSPTGTGFAYRPPLNSTNPNGGANTLSEIDGLEIEPPSQYANFNLDQPPHDPLWDTTTTSAPVSSQSKCSDNEDDEFSLPATPLIESGAHPFADDDLTSTVNTTRGHLYQAPCSSPLARVNCGLPQSAPSLHIPPAVLRPQTPTLVVDTGISGTPTGRFKERQESERSPLLSAASDDTEGFGKDDDLSGGAGGGAIGACATNRRKMDEVASSGRPTRAARHLSPCDDEYATKALPIYREDLEMALNCIMSAPSTANSDSTVEPLSDDRSSTVTDDEGAVVVAFDLFKKACDIMDAQEFAVWYKRHVSKLFKPSIMSRIKSCLDKNDPRVDPEFLVPIKSVWRTDRPEARAVLEGTYVDGFKMYKGSRELSDLIGCDTESEDFKKLDFYDHVLESKILDLFAHLVYKKRVSDGEIKPLDYCYQCIINVSGRRFVMLCHIRWEIKESGLCHLHSRFQDVSSDFQHILSLPPLPY
ncbi:Hypothetical Protein FCC1311_111792 [Hondaea fermentalgiana]|uniref:Uncharacterized protein n=1 Tax=Hondaea fermentalgiana TaxID=2315210 RepID=A0A2R5GVT9_9STRA|nr:Hypothetical Protein FCC1311_111792 [Hondaea fermentalgiana]|eukprot:GBG34956.1 Hypothetical Protein FCC1311_111792 [Hondaea fermentalgiana]